jgi:putative membrane protein
MVKKLTGEEKNAISAAVAEAERRTSAEIAVVVSPSSDAYQAYLLLYGFASGSILAALLWWTKTLTPFPALLAIQGLSMAIFAFAPFLKEPCLKLLPAKLLHYYAARRAALEFQSLSRHVPAERPIVLIYVSLAERYAHIIHSRAIGLKIPAPAWETIISELTALMKSTGLQQACVAAVGRVASTLSPHFPDKGEPNAISDSVVDKTE